MSITLRNGKKVCDCRSDEFVYRKCGVCGAEVERCITCKLVKASDCEHYDIHTQGTVEPEDDQAQFDAFHDAEVRKAEQADAEFEAGYNDPAAALDSAEDFPGDDL